MHEVNPPSPSIPNNGRTFWSAIGWQVLGLLLCGLTLIGNVSILSKKSVYFDLYKYDSSSRQSVKFPQAGAPWLNLSMLALSFSILVLLKTLYLSARRKKKAIGSILLATKTMMLGAIMQFAGIDWFSWFTGFEFLCLVMMAYAGITYRIYSSPGKLQEILNKD